jgi:hypothetical protein
VGSIDPVTGQARGFTDSLLGRRLSAGVGFAFWDFTKNPSVIVWLPLSSMDSTSKSCVPDGSD